MGMMQKPYADIVTHQRATASSRWNEFGLFEVVPANQPCIDHDPASLGASTSAVEIGLGDKTFATTAVYAVGDVVQASVSSGVFVRGRVKSSVAGSLTLEVAAVGGSGTYSAWTLIRVRGLGVWEQRTNLLTYSNEFTSNAYSPAQASILANAATAPDGKATASLLRENSNTSNHELSRTAAPSYTVGATYTLGAFFKAAGRTRVRFNFATSYTGGTPQYAVFDLSTGAVDSQNTSQAVTASIVNLGSGWYWCSFSTAITSTGYGPLFYITLLPSSGINATYQGDGSSGVYVWEAGMQQGSFRPPHIPTPASFVSRAGSATFFDANGVLQTAAANVARDNHHVFIDGAWRKAGLLLEPQATNLLQNSAAAGAVAGSPGVLPTGWAISQTPNNSTVSVVGVGVESGIPYVDIRVAGTPATTNAFLLNLGTTTVAAGQHTLSAYVKLVAGAFPNSVAFSGGGEVGATFSMVQVSASLRRVQTTWTLTAGTLNPWLHVNVVAGQAMDYTIRVGLPQLETGFVATSPIITNGSLATRAADVSTSAQVTRTGDPPHVPISAQWFRAAEGCLYVEFEANPAGTPASRVAAAFKSAAPNALEVRAVRRAGDLYPVGACSTGETLAVLTAGTANTGRERCAIAWKGGKVIFARNGSVSAEVPADPAVAQRLAIGLSDSLTASHINGWISTLRSYMRRPTDAELQTLTTIGYIPGKDT